MGCKSYIFNGYRLYIPEADEETACLCTFPHNDYPVVDADVLRSLAYLGAAVAILRHAPDGEDEYFYIPNQIPGWVREQIDAAIPVPIESSDAEAAGEKNLEPSPNEDLRRFLEAMPMITDNLRACGLHALDRLDALEVEAVSVEYQSGSAYALVLPITSGCNKIELYLGWDCISHTDGSPVPEKLACGPSHGEATFETVDGYIDWLAPHMPRRGETVRDIIEAGNPDGLVLPAAIDARMKEKEDPS